MNDELLIELVRNRPVLYDFRDPNYLNCNWKGRLWQEIGDIMEIDGNQCKARWNNIRDNFRKSLSKRRNKSGRAAKKTKLYRYESQLQFLHEYMEERETKGNVGSLPDAEREEFDYDVGNEQETSQTTEIQSSPETSNQPASQPASQKNPTTTNNTPSSPAAAFAKPARLSGGKKNTQPESEPSTLMKYILEKTEEGKSRSATGPPIVTLDNPIDCFLFGISSTLKSFSPYLQNLAKSEIFSTVQKFELQTLQSEQTDFPREK